MVKVAVRDQSHPVGGPAMPLRQLLPKDGDARTQAIRRLVPTVVPTGCAKLNRQRKLRVTFRKVLAIAARNANLRAACRVNLLQPAALMRFSPRHQRQPHRPANLKTGVNCAVHKAAIQMGQAKANSVLWITLAVPCIAV